MKKTIGLIVILVIMLIGLTGCVNINYEIEIHENGSGEISYVYGISKETLKSLETTAENFTSSMKKQAEDNNYKTEHYEDDQIEGFKATKHVKDLTKEFSLQEAFGKTYVQDEENNGIKVNKGFFKTQISQNAKIDLSTMEDAASMVQMTYTVKLPMKAKVNNATEVSKNNKILTWKLVGGEENSIEFTAKKINLVPIICIIIFLALIVATIVYFVIFSKKKKETKE